MAKVVTGSLETHTLDHLEGEFILVHLDPRYCSQRHTDDVVVDDQPCLTARGNTGEWTRCSIDQISAGIIDEGVIMQAPDGRVILMNEAARQMIGSSKNLWQSELGQFFRDAHDIPPVERQMQMVGEPQRASVNDLVLGVRLAAINADDGTHLGTVMLLKDVTQASLEEHLKDSFIAQMSHEFRTPLTSIRGVRNDRNKRKWK